MATKRKARKTLRKGKKIKTVKSLRKIFLNPQPLPP
jgi:hypothetical protein